MYVNQAVPFSEKPAEKQLCLSDFHGILKVTGYEFHLFPIAERGSTMNTLRWKRTLAALLALSLLLTLLPGGLTLPADAADTDRTAEGPLAERIALWDRVDAAVDARLSAGAQTRSRAKGRASGAPDTAGTGVPTEADFAAAAPDVAAAVEQWEDYLPGSMELREGGVVLWRDRDGVAYGYNPALRAAEALGDVTPAPEVQEILAGDLPEPPDAAPESGAVTSGIRLAPPGGNVAGSPNTGLVMPYYGAQAMWTSQDYYELQRLAEATGGQCDHYYGKYGTIDALADCLETCGVVEVATHGVPGGFCLADTGEITTEDMKDFHAYFTGYVTSSVDGTYQIAIVDGTAVVNHMEKRAPNSFVWIESCSVLKNDKMVRPLMDAGVGAVSAAGAAGVPGATAGSCTVLQPASREESINRHSVRDIRRRFRIGISSFSSQCSSSYRSTPGGASGSSGSSWWGSVQFSKRKEVSHTCTLMGLA